MAIEYKKLKERKTPMIITNKNFENKYGLKISEPLTQSVLDVVKEKMNSTQKVMLSLMGNVKDKKQLDAIQKDESKVFDILDEEALLQVLQLENEYNEKIVGAINNMDLEELKEHFANVYKDSDLGSNLYTECINELANIVNAAITVFNSKLNEGEKGK